MRYRAAAAGRRHDQAARPRPARRPTPGPRVCRCATPVGRAAGQAAGGRDPRGVSLVLPRSGRRGRTARRSRPSRQARRLLPVAVRRAAAAAVDRAGADRPAQDRGAGRDDHGLDPQARRDTWELIEQIRDRGVTIVLVTHFMEEAERLCDRVALIDHGRVVALDTPARLAAQARGGKTVRFLPSGPFRDRLLTGLPEVSWVEREGQHVLVTGTGELVNAVILALHTAGVTARDVQLDSSNLEDAFVKLTGKNLHTEGVLA